MKNTVKYFDKTINIPKDVKNGITKRLILRGTSFVLLEGLLITVAYFFSMGSGTLATQMTYLVACLAPIFITKVPFCYIDKTYIGKIEKVAVETVSKRETSMTLLNKNIVTLYVLLESGDIKVIKANEGRIKNSGIVNEYKEGDLVIHLYGTDYIVPVPNYKAGALNKKCFICGQTSRSEADKCYHCGHSLLDNIDF